MKPEGREKETKWGGFITGKLIEKFKIYGFDCSQAVLPSGTSKGKMQRR
jgi:hypothetical protein